MSISEIAKELSFNYGHMTLGECILAAEKSGLHVGDVILEEAQDTTGKKREEVIQCMEEAFAHNLRAAEMGPKQDRVSCLELWDRTWPDLRRCQ